MAKLVTSRVPVIWNAASLYEYKDRDRGNSSQFSRSLAELVAVYAFDSVSWDAAERGGNRESSIVNAESLCVELLSTQQQSVL